MGDTIDGMSMDIEKTNLERLASIFPEVMVEGQLDLTKLLDLLGQYDIKDFEKYKFEWKGKSECLQLAQRRSTGTLRPKPDESVNFDETKNVYIKGDNLEVLKLLQTSYCRQVKMIYIDPPYNTGNDFVYEDDFADPMARYKEVTAQTTRSNPETMGRFHTNWLNMMYPRLRLAANLLRDDGVCFISIDDNEVHNLRKVCDEVFGEENFVAMLPRVTKKAGKTTDAVAKNNDFLLIYTKSNNVRYNLQSHTDEGFKNTDEYFDTRGNYKLNQTLDYDSLQYSPSLDYSIELDGETFYPGNSYEKFLERQNGQYSRADWAWRWSKDLFDFGYKNGFVVIKKYDTYSRIYTKTYQNVSIEKTANGFEIVNIERTKPLSSLEFVDNQYSNDNAKKQLLSLFDTAPFDYSKPISLLKFLIAFTTKDNDIILDFFSGSATTAHAVMQLNAEDGGNRQFIMVQLPEVCDEKSEAYKAGYKNICDIGMERIRRAGAKLQLTVNKEQVTMDTENVNCNLLPVTSNLDIGFKVFELDTSNLKTWDSTPIKDEENQVNMLIERMNTMLDRVKHDRTDLDMVYEIMLKMGVPLDYAIVPIEVRGKTAYGIGDDCMLMVCLAEGVTNEIIEELATYAPAKMILSKNALKDATAMANAYYILKDRFVELKMV